MNKRAADRGTIHVPISCWVTENGRPLGTGEQLHCHDLSATGVAFETANLHRIDSILAAELRLPGRQTPLACRLRVTRLESIAAAKRYRVGASFVDLGQDDRESLVSCLSRTNIYSITRQALLLGASDIHLTVGRPPMMRCKGRLFPIKADPIEEGHIKAMFYPLLRGEQIAMFEQQKELDFAFSPDVTSRFRINLHLQKGFLEATMRSVPTHSKNFEELGLPAPIMERICRQKSGLFLVAGTTGAGKTTTMSSMVDFVNRNQERVVITIEDPIEFTHTSRTSIVKQRELGNDTASYAEALKRTLRQDPDVIVVGELSDSDTVMSALRAAETGHLVISTVHAPDAEQSIERLVNLFPPEHAASVCQQIASSLLGILFQVLLPGAKNEVVLGSELLISNAAIRNQIRERRFAQIRNAIQTGRKLGMYTLQSCFEELQRAGKIERTVAEEYARPV